MRQQRSFSTLLIDCIYLVAGEGEGSVHPGERAGHEDQPRPRQPHPLRQTSASGPRQANPARGHAGPYNKYNIERRFQDRTL